LISAASGRKGGSGRPEIRAAIEDGGHSAPSALLSGSPATDEFLFALGDPTSGKVG